MSNLIVHTSKALHEHVSITDQEMGSLIEKAFPDAKVENISPLEYGYNNKIALVTLSGEQDFSKCVIKISVSEDKFKKLEVECDILKKLAEKQPDLPLPRVLYSDFRRSAFPLPFAIYSFLPGTSLVTAIERITNKEVIGTELGRIVATIHSVTFERPSFSLSEPPSPKTWKQVIKSKIDESLPYFEKSNSPHTPMVAQVLQRNYDNLTEPETYHLVHRDLQPQNMSWDLEKNRLAGLFDFETAMSGDPLYEFSLLERKLFRLYPEIKRSFYKTYSSISPLPEGFQERTYFYLLTQLVYFYMRSVQKDEEDRLLLVKEEVEEVALRMR